MSYQPLSELLDFYSYQFNNLTRKEKLSKKGIELVANMEQIRSTIMVMERDITNKYEYNCKLN